MTNNRNRIANILKPFTGYEGLDKKLILVFIMINAIVLANAVLHDPRIGYDARAHLKYIDALSELRLVTQNDTYEFYSPPLPYFLPAVIMYLTQLDLLWVGKFAQLINFLLSLGATYFLIRSCDRIHPDSSLKFNTLILLLILPVYYKTFSQVRGEPYLVFFAVLLLDTLLRMIQGQTYKPVNAVLLGGTMGCLILSRQWGIFLLPGAFLLLGDQWLRHSSLRRQVSKTILIAAVTTIAVGGWFYTTLKVQYGSFSAFNREPAPSFSLRNQSKDFYLDFQREEIFKKPVRPNFSNLFVPTFYSEIWGDYWGYFTLFGVDTQSGEYLDGYQIRKIARGGAIPPGVVTNYFSIRGYLGRVNLVSLVPSGLLLVSLLISLGQVILTGNTQPTQEIIQTITPYLLFSILLTMMGYFWFLIMYPIPGKGDTIKATYVIQIFPYLAILGGYWLNRIKNRIAWGYWVILLALGICFLHNLPASVTHYSFLRLVNI